MTVHDVELPSLRNANVNIKGNTVSLPTLMKKKLRFNLKKGPSLGLLDLPSYSLAFRLFSPLEITVILYMGTSK